MKGWTIPMYPGEKATFISRSEVISELIKLSMEKDLIQYYLWTDNNPIKEQRIFFENFTNLEQTYFNKSNPTRVMVHGIQSSHKSPVCTHMKDAFLSKGPQNFICMDWSKIAYKPVPVVRFAIPSTGRNLGKFMEFILKHGKTPKKKFMLIAHSYGTQVAGYGAKYMKKINNMLPLMVMCDPASPLFPYEDCASRVCKTDAKFVESIQTTAGVLGYARPIGDGAYYPNGGSKQPGCSSLKCSHLRSYQYLIEAVVKNDFPTNRCHSFQNALSRNCEKSFSSVKMGSLKSYGVKGIFYVPVNSKPPYGYSN